jgi:hypothetical protein
MVLAKRRELNVFHDYQLIVVFVEHGVVHDGSQVLFIAFCKEEHCFRITHWRLQQAISVRILTYAFQNRPYSARQLRQAFFFFLLG